MLMSAPGTRSRYASIAIELSCHKLLRFGYGELQPHQNLKSDLSKSATTHFLPNATDLCPSVKSAFFCATTPPGNFGLSRPSLESTRQYGVTVFLPARRFSSAASAAIRTNIPVQRGQATSTLLRRASSSRS